jgi:hypothetical protein
MEATRSSETSGTTLRTTPLWKPQILHNSIVYLFTYRAQQPVANYSQHEYKQHKTTQEKNKQKS